MQSIIFTLYTKVVHTDDENLVNKPATQDIKTKARVCVAVASRTKSEGKTQSPGLGDPSDIL